VLAFGLFIFSGIVWIAFLVRLQHRLIQLYALPAAAGEPLPRPFFHALHAWYIAGSVATVSPMLSLILMVVKPTFW
jgi:uncharacterized membrane protein